MTREQVREAWRVEIHRRIAASDNGEMPSIPGEQVMQELRDRLENGRRSESWRPAGRPVGGVCRYNRQSCQVAIVLSQETPMTMEQIRAEAMSLQPAEREALAEELLLSLTDGDRDAIDAAWLAEAHRRDAEYESGRATASPVDEVIARIRAKARK